MAYLRNGPYDAHACKETVVAIEQVPALVDTAGRRSLPKCQLLLCTKLQLIMEAPSP